MDRFEADHQDSRIAGILHALGVSTKRSVHVVSRESHTIASAMWDGGTRTLTATRRCPKAQIGDTFPLGPESVVAEHGTFCGKTSSVTLYVHPELFESLKPAEPTVALFERQKRVLALTAALNSRGRADWRDRHNVEKADWDSVVAELCTMGLVRKNGAILPEGRNAAPEQYQRNTHSLNGLEAANFF